MHCIQIPYICRNGSRSHLEKVELRCCKTCHDTALESRPNSQPGLIPSTVSNFYPSRAILIFAFFSLTSRLPNDMQGKRKTDKWTEFFPGATHSTPITNISDLLDSFNSGKCLVVLVLNTTVSSIGNSIDEPSFQGPISPLTWERGFS